MTHHRTLRFYSAPTLPRLPERNKPNQKPAKLPTIAAVHLLLWPGSEMAGVSLYGIMDWPFYLASWFWRLDERADRHLDALTKYIDGLAGQMDRVCATTCDKLENRCDELERKMDDIGDIGEGKIDELESDLETKMDEVESDLEGKVKEVAFDLGTKMDDTESGLGARVQEIEDDMDLRFDGLVDRLETWEKKINLHVEEQASYITQQLVQSGLEIGQAGVQTR